MTTSLDRTLYPLDEAAVAASPSLPLANKRILLVEDCEDNLVLLLEILRRSGAAVATASNGAEGIKQACNQHFDVILMDIQMPVMDGYQATQLLRESGYNRPIVALTAYAIVFERERCLASGFDAHMTKPVNRHLLIQHLQRLTTPGHSAVH